MAAELTRCLGCILVKEGQECPTLKTVVAEAFQIDPYWRKMEYACSKSPGEIVTVTQDKALFGMYGEWFENGMKIMAQFE
jgi:hypothetical protein